MDNATLTNVVAHGSAVAAEGISTGKLLAGSGVLLSALVGIIRIIWNTRVPMKKVKIEAEQKFRDDILTRMAKCEADNERLRAESEHRETVHEAREALLRHELQNTRTCFTYLVMFLKRMRDPSDELKGILADVETMRAEQKVSEDLERAALPTLKPFNAESLPTDKA